ncbi:MAG: radical SAM protein [Candidatus Aenigmarchaeota archaeon]|nr:radical SAM protein [Candidatus Aenigmarchaeota archaeon]
MKIVLVDPKGLTLGLNSGLGYMASSLKKKGHKVAVLDFNNKRGNEKKRLDIVKNADYVGISIKSFTLNEAIKLARLVKKINKKAVVLAGGPHITIDGYNFLKENECFDMAVIGEGEKILIEIIEKKNLKNIAGIIYRNGKEIKINQDKHWIKNLDTLPFPNYKCFDSVMDAYPLVTSRGCPYSCTYCSVRDVMGTLWRARKPENIIEELKTAKEKYKINEFKVLDDNFTLDINRAKKLCEMLIANNINMKWSCPNGIRADRLDNELLLLMKESGCYSISIGIESMHPEVFEKLEKGEKLTDVKNAIRMIKEKGMKIKGFFIIGLPGSTYEKDKFSLKESKKLGIEAAWGILVPYPGTRIWLWLEKKIKLGNARILRDWKKGFHIGLLPKPVYETSSYKAKDMLKIYYMANLRYLKLNNLLFIIKSMFRQRDEENDKLY